jgi:hypothetical protein
LYISALVMSRCCCAGVGKNPVLLAGFPLCEGIMPGGEVCGTSDNCIRGDVAGTKGYEDGPGLGGIPRPVALPGNCDAE